MSQSPQGPSKGTREPGIAKRDLILIPLITLLTAGILAGCTELVGRALYPSLRTGAESCMNLKDPAGARGIPNSVCEEKTPEGEFTEYRMNNCGFRTAIPCGGKKPQNYRIVLIGTSFAIGLRVPIQKTFAFELAASLSQSTGRHIEIYNEAMPWRFPDTLARRFDEIKAAQPDLILWALNPNDIKRLSDVEIPTGQLTRQTRKLNLVGRAILQLKSTIRSRSVSSSLSYLFAHTRTSTLVSQLFYGSASQYITYALMQPDEEIGYLRSEPSSEWQRRLSNFDIDVAEIATQARTANIPLVAVMLPNRVQAAMIATNSWPSGYDPYKIDTEARSIFERHGAIYLDIMPYFRRIPDPQLDFYAVEGHPNPRGHAVFTDLLAEELTKNPVPAPWLSGRSITAQKKVQ